MSELELSEVECLVIRYRLKGYGRRVIANLLQDRYSEPTWNDAAVKREIDRLIERLERMR